MTDDLSKFDMLRALKAQDRRIGQTEVKEVPLTDIGARAYNDVAISINNNTVTVVTFNSEIEDTDGIHSTSVNTGRLTCTRNGTYEIAGGFEFAPNTAGVRVAYIRLNGATILASAQGIPDPANVFNASINLATHYPLVVGDYVELLAYQNSGGALNIAIGNLTPWFAMRRMP